MNRSWIVKYPGHVIKYYNTDCTEAKNEIKILSMLYHENIIELLFIAKNSLDNIMIFMPNEDSTLCDILESQITIPMKTKFDFIYQIITGLNYIHSNNILHLDLKPDNIMITKNHIRIIDFGSSEFCIDDNVISNKTKCTATHRAPEAYVKYVFDAKFDIWSFGIIVYEIITGTPIYLQKIFPRYEINNLEYDSQVYQIIISNEFNRILSTILSRDLIHCINLNPSDRPNAKFLIEKLSYR